MIERFFTERFFTAVMQYMIARMLMGGMYVKMKGRWYPCHTLRVLADGTRSFKRDDADGGAFYDTSPGVENIKEYL
jgi:hypothetical protein